MSDAPVCGLTETDQTLMINVFQNRLDDHHSNSLTPYSMESMSALVNAYSILKDRYNNLKAKSIKMRKEIYQMKKDKSCCCCRNTQDATNVVGTSNSSIDKPDLLIGELEKLRKFLDCYSAESINSTCEGDLKDVSMLLGETVIPKMKKIEMEIGKSNKYGGHNWKDESLCSPSNANTMNNEADATAAEAECLEPTFSDDQLKRDDTKPEELRMDLESKLETVDNVSSSSGYDDINLGDDLTELAQTTLKQNRDLQNICKSLKRQNEFLKNLYRQETEKNTILQKVSEVQQSTQLSSDWSLIQNS